VTATEFAYTTDDEFALSELDNGTVTFQPFLSWRAGSASCNICVALATHAKTNGLGQVYAAKTGFQLDVDTVRAPSTSLVGRTRVEPSSGFITGAPDLAVELYEDGRSLIQLMRKVKQYFAAGTHTVWIVYPDRKEVQILDAKGADVLLQDNDLLDAPELLPGFSVAISQFFEE
jgi:Uma2 family endonuclease